MRCPLADDSARAGPDSGRNGNRRARRESRSRSPRCTSIVSSKPPIVSYTRSTQDGHDANRVLVFEHVDQPNRAGDPGRPSSTAGRLSHRRGCTHSRRPHPRPANARNISICAARKVGMPDIIAIQQREVGAARLAHPEVPRRRGSLPDRGARARAPRSSRSARRRASASVPSVEPSSTINSSKSVNDCAITESTVSCRYASELCAGMMMLTTGLPAGLCTGITVRSTARAAVCRNRRRGDTGYFSCSRKTSSRCVPIRGSMPSVFSQLDVKITHRPSGETLGRGRYQNSSPAGLASWRTSLR